MNLNLTLAFNYIESFFNAFQGLVVAVACCFTQRDVRFQVLLFACECFQAIGCHTKFECFKCSNPDYIKKIKQKYNDNRSTLNSFSYRSSYTSTPHDRKRGTNHLSEIEEDFSFNSSSRATSIVVNGDCNGNLTTTTLLTPPISTPTRQLSIKPSNKKDLNTKKKFLSPPANMLKKDSATSLASVFTTNSDGIKKKTKFFPSVCYECLFDSSKRNDFYQLSHRQHSKKYRHSSNDVNVNKNNSNSNCQMNGGGLLNQHGRSESNSSSEASFNVNNTSKTSKQELMRRWPIIFRRSMKTKLESSSAAAATADEGRLTVITTTNENDKENNCTQRSPFSKMVHFDEPNTSNNNTETNKINENNNSKKTLKSLKKSNIKKNNVNIFVNNLTANDESTMRQEQQEKMQEAILTNNINITTWPLLESIDAFIDDEVDG